MECTFNSGRHRGRSFRDVLYNEPGSRDLFQSLDWEERPRYLGTSPDEADAFLEYCNSVPMPTALPALLPPTTVANFAWATEDYEILVDIDELEKSIRKMLMGAKVSGGCYATT